MYDPQIVSHKLCHKYPNFVTMKIYFIFYYINNTCINQFNSFISFEF